MKIENIYVLHFLIEIENFLHTEYEEEKTFQTNKTETMFLNNPL